MASPIADTARTMSQEILDFVRAVIDAVARQDAAGLMELTDPEVEWHPFAAQLAEGGVYRGHEGIKRYVSDLGDAWEFLRGEADDALVVGNVVVLVGHLRFRGRGSGVETEVATGWVLKLRNRRVVYMRSFRDPEQALLTLGLSEQDAHADS
jgi:ketosteroid isomerase-like protein